MITNDKSKCSKKFSCIQCDYYTSRLSQFNRHLLTAKHKMIINDNNIVPDKNLQCKCGKIYKYMSGLSRHKKQCNQKMELSEPNLELTLLSENNEEFPIISQELIIEMVKKQQDQIFELTHAVFFGGYLSDYSGDDIPAFHLEFYNAGNSLLGSTMSYESSSHHWEYLFDNIAVP